MGYSPWGRKESDMTSLIDPIAHDWVFVELLTSQWLQLSKVLNLVAESNLPPGEIRINTY